MTDQQTLPERLAELPRRYAEQVESAIRAEVGLTLRGSIRVRIERPRWMPKPLPHANHRGRRNRAESRGPA